MPSGRTDFCLTFDRMQTWHRHRYRKRARTISDQAMESYLREDVPCGFPMCNMCSPTLPHLPRTASHLVIPDCTILETYLEVFQLPELQGVIYMTSVVKQVGSMTAKCFLKCGMLSHCSLCRLQRAAIRGRVTRYVSCTRMPADSLSCLMIHIVSGLLVSQEKLAGKQ